MKTASGFNGKRFSNPYAATVPLKEMGKWLISRKRPSWPGHAFAPVSYDGMMWLHHSTCSLKMNGLHLLTDPIWAKICGPLGLIGPLRGAELTVALEELDKVDIILLSHNHFDHMCLRTLKRLKKLFDPFIVTGLGNKRHLKGFSKVIELDWWQTEEILSLPITYVPAAHFSSRSLFDRNKSLWGGFVIAGEKKVYFAGDSGYGLHFNEIAAEFAPFDYCFLPIGSYKPEEVLHPVHIGPRQAAYLHKLMQAKKSIPIHYGTFQLGDEDWYEPLEELKKEMLAEGLSCEAFLFPSET